MNLTERVTKTLESEKERANADSTFAKAIRMIDSLKQQGILQEIKYKIPLPDTVNYNRSARRVDSGCR